MRGRSERKLRGGVLVRVSREIEPIGDIYIKVYI